MKVGHWAKYLEDWNQNDRSGLIVVLEQFGGKRQQWQHDFIAEVFKGQFFIYFFAEGWDYCF